MNIPDEKTETFKACAKDLAFIRDNVLTNHPEATASINRCIAELEALAATTGPVEKQIPPNQDKRAEPRDPGEFEQHEAEAMGLAPEPDLDEPDPKSKKKK